MSNVYVHFSQISFPARYSVVKMQRREALRLGVFFCHFTYLELETEMTTYFLEKTQKNFLNFRNSPLNAKTPAPVKETDGSRKIHFWVV